MLWLVIKWIAAGYVLLGLVITTVQAVREEQECGIGFWPAVYRSLVGNVVEMYTSMYTTRGPVMRVLGVGITGVSVLVIVLLWPSEVGYKRTNYHPRL